jgi:hypothetical protein
MANYNFYSWYLANKIGKTGLTVTVDVRNSAGMLVVTDANATELGGGLYKYTHATTTITDYVAVFKTEDATVDSQQIPSLIISQVMKIDSIPADVWASTTRPVGSTISAVAGNDVIAYAGDTLSFSLTGLGSLADASKLYLSVKSSPNDADTASIIQLEKTAGLLYLNGAAGTAGNGSLTVTDATLGNITATLTPTESVKIACTTYFYDVKKITASGASTCTQGKIEFVSTVTKAVA